MNHRGNFWPPEKVPPRFSSHPKPSSSSLSEALRQYQEVRTRRTKSTHRPCPHSPHQGLVVLSATQAHSCLRAFALAVPSAWEASPPTFAWLPPHFIPGPASVSPGLPALFSKRGLLCPLFLLNELPRPCTDQAQHRPAVVTSSRHQVYCLWQLSSMRI